MTTETRIALTSAFVSVLALGLTMYEAWATRRHNRLSVKPALSFDLVLDEEQCALVIRLRNNGLGPAVVRRYEMLVDGRSLEQLNIRQFQELSALLDVQARYSIPLRDEVIPIDASIDLIVIKHDTTDAKARYVARRAAQRLTIRTAYSSMYDDYLNVQFNGTVFIPPQPEDKVPDASPLLP
jgi:hypothetical protein